MTRLAFVVNGEYESAMGQRARAFVSYLADRFDIRVVYRSRRKVISILRFIGFLVRYRPAVSYVFDMAYSGVLSASFYKMIVRNVLIIDTGDVISALARSMGNRWFIGLWLTDCLERFSLWSADCIVVRGSFHRDLLREKQIRVELIRDGVDTEQFAPCNISELRRQNGLENVLTVGVVGTSIWSEKLQSCYGWELVEALRLLADKPVKGIFIGNGSGIAHLKSKCREYGIEDKLWFPGFVPYEQLPTYLGMIDVCLSTQTRDIVGRVRTTGKLPLYLASGRHILASKVGEAALVLDDEMLADYEGVKDCSYPVKLAQRIRSLLDRRVPFEPCARNVALALEQFDYRVLSDRLAAVIDRALHNSSGQTASGS
jgi:glycosyltransferase involved in cell wall biosynthesis